MADNGTNHDDLAIVDNAKDTTITELEEMDAAEESVLDPEAQIALLTQDKEAIFKRLLMSEADMENLRRRTERDVAHAHKYALERFVKELLPIIDALELEITAITDNEEVSAELKQFQEGSKLTYRMLLNACEKFGVKQLKPMGEKLNPEFHQAVTMLPNTEHESNTIIQVIQSGYSLNDRLIRAAQVIVAQ